MQIVRYPLSRWMDGCEWVTTSSSATHVHCTIPMALICLNTSLIFDCRMIGMMLRQINVYFLFTSFLWLVGKAKQNQGRIHAALMTDTYTNTFVYEIRCLRLCVSVCLHFPFRFLGTIVPKSVTNHMMTDANCLYKIDEKTRQKDSHV